LPGLLRSEGFGVDSETKHDLPTPARKAAWAVVAVVAWYLWLSAAGLLSGTLLGLVLALGPHPDSDLIFFAAVYAVSGLYLILVGYVGDRLLELTRLPFAAWKPGVLVVAATSLASISTRASMLGRVEPSSVIGTYVLPFVLAPGAVLVGIWVATARQHAQDRQARQPEAGR
jgi:hypothetical protein